VNWQEEALFYKKDRDNYRRQRKQILREIDRLLTVMQEAANYINSKGDVWARDTSRILTRIEGALACARAAAKEKSGTP